MKHFLIVTLATVLYSAWAYIEGYREALYYHYKTRSIDYDLDRGEHNVFTAQRVISLTTMFAFVFHFLTNVECLLFLVGIVMMFMFIHDNAYYQQRHKLDPSVYPNGFNNQTTSSTSKMDNWYATMPIIRDALFVIGISIVLSIALNII